MAASHTSVTVANVDAAALRLRGRIHRTALLESIALNNLTHARILVKAECTQKAGSFKIRGAMNRVLCLSPQEQKKGVVAFSSGNFGQGLAAACGALGVQCTIVMPGDAPVSKQERARSYGSVVVTSELIEGVNREVTAAEMAKELSRTKGFTLLHPFEDLDVIAGQGTCALEICEQAREAGVSHLDALVIPVGGGGLTAGCCLAMEREMPSCNVYAVEPEGYDDHVRSLAAGKRLSVEGTPVSICDSLQAVAPGENTFPINQRLLKGAVAVSDDEVRYAMQVAFEMLQIVLEPGGATALAAVLMNKVPCGVVGRTICIVGSGGNLNFEKFAKSLGCPVSLPPPPAHISERAFDWTGWKVEHIDGLHRPLILIKSLANGSYLACGYVSVDTAENFGEVCGIVTGVATAADVLTRPLVRLTTAAKAAGLKEGMLGSEALTIMKAIKSKSRL